MYLTKRKSLFSSSLKVSNDKYLPCHVFLIGLPSENLLINIYSGFRASRYGWVFVVNWVTLYSTGTCVNNTSVMMFKKGSFEIGCTVYPVAIKVRLTTLAF